MATPPDSVIPRSPDSVTGDPEPEDLPWYRQSTNLIIWAIFLPVLGTVLVWMFARWPVLAKAAATAWAVFLLLLLFAFGTNLVPSEFSRPG